MLTDVIGHENGHYDPFATRVPIDPDQCPQKNPLAPSTQAAQEWNADVTPNTLWLD